MTVAQLYHIIIHTIGGIVLWGGLTVAGTYGSLRFMRWFIEKMEKQE